MICNFISFLTFIVTILLLLPRLNYSIHNKLVNAAPVKQSAT